MGTTRGNRIMAFAGIVGTIGGNRSDVLIFGCLVEQFRQHGGVTHIVSRDFDSPNFQCFLVDAYMYLAPDASFGATMLTRILLAFTFQLDASTVDKKVQRASAAAIRQAKVQRLWTATKGAKIRG